MSQSKAIIHQVKPELFIGSLSSKLKDISEFDTPEWANFVKTSAAKERVPQNDWWHIRAASVLRKIYINGVIGVERLKKEYTSKKDRGAKPEKVYKAGGKIIRTVLHQAEKSGLIELTKKPKAGRQLTKKGLDFLNNVIDEVKK